RGREHLPLLRRGRAGTPPSPRVPRVRTRRGDRGPSDRALGRHYGREVRLHRRRPHRRGVRRVRRLLTLNAIPLPSAAIVQVLWCRYWERFSYSSAWRTAMKWRASVLAVLGATALIAAACGRATDAAAGNNLPVTPGATSQPPAGRVAVVAAENFWGNIAQQIGGDTVQVTSV